MFAKDKNEVANEMQTDIVNGLDEKVAEEKLKTFGPNKLADEKSKTIFGLFLDQFKDFLVIILIIAAIVSCMIGEFFDGSIIIAIVILNACLGVYQENKANNAFAALKEMARPHAKVLRNKKISQIQTDLLVPGDIVIIEAGDYIPADIRLIESVNLKINESALTGESIPATKNADVVLDSQTVLGDRINCAYMSSIVSAGRGRGIVIATGMNTQIGKIASMLNETPEQITPLQKKLNSFGKLLGCVCLFVCILIFFIGLMHNIESLQIFMTAVSLAVAAIPEGLSVVVTVILAMGMQKMVKINSIIKKLSAVETLGSVTVICSDKTGTLTQNKMTVVKFYTNGKIFDADKNKIEIKNETDLLHTQKLFEIGVLCNDSQFSKEKSIGDPTESSLLEAAEKINLYKDDLNEKYPRDGEIAFDSDRKLMSTLNKYGEKFIVNTKGAPDEILKCTKFIFSNGQVKELTQDDKKNIIKANDGFAKNAYRVLAASYKIIDDKKNFAENDLIFTGLIGMIDPPRIEAKDAIKICKDAGINVKMITGDHKTTAVAIANDLGIISDSSQSMEGIEIDNMTEAQLQEKIRTTHVFARVSPQHKVKLVNAIKANGNIVAMTGDGVNDAPSLKNADIGIAMGITGTDVSKEAADMILTDDNFASIVKAVEQGRIIYANIRKVIAYLLSCNIGEILLIFIALLFNLPSPLTPIHLLSINLITDAFPAFALGIEEGDEKIMQRAPNNPNEPLVNKRMKKFITVQSIALSFASLLSFVFILKISNYTTASSACFVTLVAGELLRAYSSRSDKKFLFSTKVLSNKFLNRCVIFSLIFLFCSVYLPFLNKVFATTMLSSNYLIISFLFSLIPIISGEIFKLVVKS